MLYFFWIVYLITITLTKQPELITLNIYFNVQINENNIQIKLSLWYVECIKTQLLQE